MKRAHVLLLVLTLALTSGAAGRGCAEPAGSGGSVPIPKAATYQFHAEGSKDGKPRRATIYLKIGDDRILNDNRTLPWSARHRVGAKDFVEFVVSVPMFRPGDELFCAIFDKGRPIAQNEARYPDRPAEVTCPLAALTDRMGALPSAHG